MGRYTLAELDPRRVAPHPDNDYDMSPEAVARLARSIEEHGLAQPPLVRRLPDGTYQAVAGHRRLAAFERLAVEHPKDPRWRKVPCLVAEGMGDREARVLLDVTNLETRELTAAERAARVASLAELVPGYREAVPETRGVRSTEVMARMLREAGVAGATEGQVRYAMQRDARRRKAVAAVASLDPTAREMARAEAQAGRLDEATVRRVAALSPEAQARCAAAAQRAGGGLTAWSRAADAEQGAVMPQREAEALALAAERAMDRLLAAMAAGVRISGARAAALAERASEVARANREG